MGCSPEGANRCSRARREGRLELQRMLGGHGVIVPLDRPGAQPLRPTHCVACVQRPRLSAAIGREPDAKPLRVQAHISRRARRPLARLDRSDRLAAHLLEFHAIDRGTVQPAPATGARWPEDVRHGERPAPWAAKPAPGQRRSRRDLTAVESSHCLHAEHGSAAEQSCARHWRKRVHHRKERNFNPRQPASASVRTGACAGVASCAVRPSGERESALPQNCRCSVAGDRAPTWRRSQCLHSARLREA